MEDLDDNQRTRPSHRVEPSVAKSALHSMDLTGARSLVRTPHLAGGLAERSWIRSQVSGLAERNAIEQIVGLGAELQPHALGDSRRFLQYQVPVVNSRTTEVIAAQVATCGSPKCHAKIALDSFAYQA